MTVAHHQANRVLKAMTHSVLNYLFSDTYHWRKPKHGVQAIAHHGNENSKEWEKIPCSIMWCTQAAWPLLYGAPLFQGCLILLTGR